MRAPMLWNPFRDVAAMNPFLDLVPLMKDFPMGSFLEPEPMMRMNVAETPGGYLVKAELPGVAKEDVSVSVEGRTVSISAETKREKDEKEGDKLLRSERYFGAVSRSMTLPEDLDVEHAEATFENGMLTLTLPKVAGAEARKLPIH